MSIITQPPQATLTILRRSGTNVLLAGCPEDIRWVMKFFIIAGGTYKTVRKFFSRHIHRVERREFDKLVEVVEFFDPD